VPAWWIPLSAFFDFSSGPETPFRPGLLFPFPYSRCASRFLFGKSFQERLAIVFFLFSFFFAPTLRAWCAGLVQAFVSELILLFFGRHRISVGS